MRRAVILNLLPHAETDQPSLCEKLAVDSCTVIQGKAIRERGAWDGLNFLRKTVRETEADTIALHCVDWSRQTHRTALYGLACLVPSKSRCVIDINGQVENLTWPELIFTELPSALSQHLKGKALLAKSEAIVDEGLLKASQPHEHRILEIKSIVYMRTDLWYGVKAGGSIGHVAGVIDGFGRNGINVHVLSWDRPPLVPESVDFTKIESDGFFRNDRELALLAYNARLIDMGTDTLRNDTPDAIYARYALNCYAPVLLSEKFNVPLIIEYNGSEIWIESHWGRGLKHPEISEKIENWVLKSADFITVVSKPLRDELAGRGIDSGRILVNPNAVDPSRFDPSTFDTIELEKIRRSLGIRADAVVAGFIGTFSPWHGVEILADAIPDALEKCPGLHFLLIGSGPLFDSVVSKIYSAGAADHVSVTGIVPQDEAAKYLMCSDFFLSPHVPNPDGTPFFGSPTKLFEYMALGKGIIASDLDQLGEMLEHDKTALLVPPSDIPALVGAIEKLFKDRILSRRLGQAARVEALKNHTWEAHVGKILDALYAVFSSS